MDEELVETDIATVGERLRAAREERGMALEDVAAQTRIPLRHLLSLETSSWDQLPATTYTTGFAKSYASAVGLDRAEIGNQLRAEMGGERPLTAAAEVHEAADPARTMPKWLVLGAIAALILLVVVLSALNRRALQGDDGAAPAAQPTAAGPVAAVPTVPVPTPAAGEPVVLTASEPVWLQVYEKGGKPLFSGELASGQVYAIPADARAPMLKTGKPEALRITVGNSAAPAVGPAATTVRDVSLLGPDLMRGGAQAAAPAAPAR